MSESMGTTPAAELPRVPLLDALRHAVTMGGRNDMRGPLERLRRAHGDVVMHAAGPLRSVNLFGPDANRLVLLDRDGIFSAKRPWDLIMGRIFPNGLLLRDGADHKHHRKIMHGAFKRPALRDYADRMNPMIEERLAGWADEAAEVDGPHTRLAFPSYKALTLDLAASIFVGVDLGPGTARMNGIFEDLVAASMSRIRLPIPGLEFQRGLQGRKALIAFFQELMPKKRSGEGSDMFSRLCAAESEEGDRFRDEEVIDHMIFLMMAAHDTTTSTLTSMTYLLARHPEWQERLREESRGFGNAHAEFDRGDALPGLGLVLRETLRLYPPLPVIPRICSEDFEFQGYRVPADSMVVVAPVHTHRMPEWWSEPERFDPERFAAPRSEQERHTHSWIPFGGGPHHCIGLRFAETQVKAVMHQLLLRFRWSVPEGYEMPVQQAPISKPQDGLPIQMALL